MTLEENALSFESRILKQPNECWEWQGARSNGDKPRKYRYGFKTPPILGEKLAHRISWRLYRGEIPDGLWVLHRCDNPPCVNPAHLFLGTRQDNMNDAIKKGRYKHIKPIEYEGPSETHIQLRISRIEKRQIQRAATRAGLSVSAWLRGIAQREAGKA